MMITDTSTVEDFYTHHTTDMVHGLSPRQLENPVHLPVITISMEPGSGGTLIARGVADRLGFDLYHNEILLPMSNITETDPEVLKMIEKSRLSGIQDLVASIINKDYLHPGLYRQHLERIVKGLGKIGHAVIIGRGANFILSPEERFAIRIIAPLDTRVKNVAFAFGLSLSEAEKRIKHRAARRKAFVKEAFKENIDEPHHYDLIINTGRLDQESAVETIIGTLLGSQVNHAFKKAESYILRKRKYS